MTDSPAEIRAFLIADVRAYTRFTVENGDEAAARLAAAFAELVSKAVEGMGGQVAELRGDEALAVFTSARQAVRAATEIQRLCEERARGDASLPLRVGIGLDAGEAVPVLGGYRGQALNLAARLCSLAGVDEVLASDSLTHLAGRVEGIRYEPRGNVQLKGFAEPVDVVAVEAEKAGKAGESGREAAERPEERLPIGAYLGSLPAGPLVGRDAERERLLAAIDAVGPGAGRTVLLAGEPGAGKTRLTQEAMLPLRDRCFVIAAGACLETRQAVPYFPFLDVLPKLAEAYRRAGQGDLSRWPYAERLVAVGGGAPGDSAEAEEERVRRDVAAFIAALAEHAPVAILVDDLHWADASTLEMVHQLARQLRGARVFLAATYRDVEVRHDHPLEQVLRALRRDELAEVIPVKRLDQEGTAALVAASFGYEKVSEEFSTLIHNQTDGNAFFVQQVLRALVERGDVYREGSRWERRELAEIEVPESIRSAVGERVDRLPDASRGALSAASVLGQRFRFEDLLAIVEAGEDELERALEVAVASDLLSSDGGDTYSFEHALAQQTLLGELPARRRRRLHGLAGAALEARVKREPALAAEVAYHYLEADQPEPAARWSLAAGRHAEEMVALAEAESHFRQAVELAEELGDGELRVEATERLGTILGRRGKFEAAVALLAPLVADRRTGGDLDGEARAVRALCWNIGMSGRSAEALAQLEDFLERAGPSLPDRSRAALLVLVARPAFTLGRMDRVLSAATAAEQAAERAGDLGLRVEAMGRRALALHSLEGYQVAAPIFREAIALADETVPVDIRAVVHNNYAWTVFCLGDFSANLEQRRIALALNQRFALPPAIAFANAMLAQAELYLGRMKDSLEHARGALAIIEGEESGWTVGYVIGQLGSCLVWHDEVDEGEKLLRGGLAAADARGDLQLGSWMRRELSWLLTDTGRAEEAYALLRPAVDEETAYVFRLLIALAYAERALGRPEAAETHARRAADGCRELNDFAQLVDALIVLGGAGALQEAITLADRMPYPFGSGWARLELAAVSERVDAERLVGEAEELIERHQLLYLRRRMPARPAEAQTV